jgi:hypothetical protein
MNYICATCSKEKDEDAFLTGHGSFLEDICDTCRHEKWKIEAQEKTILKRKCREEGLHWFEKSFNADIKECLFCGACKDIIIINNEIHNMYWENKTGWSLKEVTCKARK